MSQARVQYVKHARQRYAMVTQVDEQGATVRTPVTTRRGTPRLAKGGRQVARRVSVPDLTKPLPNYTCGKCRDEIKVGDPYRYFRVGFRGYKQVRCMKPGCTPTQATLESSLLADVYSAQESAYSTLDSADAAEASDHDSIVADVQGAIDEVAEAIETVAQQYRDQDEAFGGQGATEGAERADTLEAALDELQSWSPSSTEPDPCDEHETIDDECDDCTASVDDWRDELVQSARDTIDGLELP